MATVLSLQGDPQVQAILATPRSCAIRAGTSRRCQQSKLRSLPTTRVQDLNRRLAP